MKKRIYKKGAAIILSAAMMAGNLSGFSMVQAQEITEQAEDTLEYVFEGNMIKNGEFDNGTDNWTVTGGNAGTASNNGYPSGDTHYWTDPGVIMEQTISVPYTGTYHASTWISVSGTGGVFGAKDAEGNILASAEIANQKEYKQYELEFPLKKGDSVTVYIQGASGWTNGDKFSLEFDVSEFGQMLTDPDFENGEGWNMRGGASVEESGAVLPDAASSVYQDFYVPKSGPYIAEVEIEGASDAQVSFGDVTETVTGSRTVQLKLDDLAVGDEIRAAVKGTATVKSFTARFDLEALDNQAPSATEVEITQNPEIGSVLEGSYHYEDPDGHEEKGTIYKWYVADEEDGTYTEIEGADKAALELTEEYRDQYVKFEVTPVDEYLGIGDAVQSSPAGPVYLNVIPNGGFEEGTGDWKNMTGEKVVAEKWTYDGWYRGNIKAGATGWQEITVPESGYYDLSAYIRCPGAGTPGTLSVKDQAGTVIKETSAEALSDAWNYYGLKEIPLEEGSKVQVCFTAADKTMYIDNVVMKAQRGREIPPFANIKSFETDPEAYKTAVSSEKKTVELTYYYGTHLSEVTLEGMQISEGAQASVKTGDVLDLTKECQITVTAKDGTEEIWTVTAEHAEKKVALESSNKYLEDTFNWAAHKMDQFVMTGIEDGPINVPQSSGQTADYIPSYWAGYYDRTAFYARDFVHQATGGQIAGLADENFSMFKAFAKECTEERKWYTVWALNFDGSVYTMDYNSADSFVREVPAQFELVEKAYEQYLWSGDERYITDETLWDFYTNVMTKYVDSHDANGNGVVQEVGTGIFNGSCTYNERGRHVIEAGDAIGSQYQATLAYAGMLKARGEDAEAEKWYQKAEDLKTYFNEEWSVSDDMESGYVCAWGPNGERYSDFSKETSWFIPMKQITEPGERNDEYIDFVLENLGSGIGSTSTAPSNIEAYTYIPDMLFPYNRADDAWTWMKYITSIKDEPHARPIQGTNGDYPEISFTFVSHTIEGMMGVEPDAGRGFVATVPRLPSEVPDVTAKYMQIGDYELDLTHDGNAQSELTNHNEDKAITWEARFYGEYDSISFDGNAVPAQTKEINGETVSYAEVTVPAGESVHAEAIQAADKEDLAGLITYAQSQKESEDYQYVVPAVKAAFEKALAEAAAVNANEAATQAEVDAAYDRLLDMVHMLSFTGNSESLKALVDVAAGMNPDLYTEATWAAVEEALEQAEAVLANENALQKEIDAARDALQAAIDALEKIPVDKSKLQQLVEKAKEYEDAIDKYTPSTGELFTAVLADARDVLADEDVLQQEVDAAYSALQNAIWNLRLIPDKSVLEELIKEAEAVDTSNYTEASAAVFKMALANAKVVYADADATEDEVKAAESALREAKENLVAKEDNTGNVGNIGDNTDNANNGNSAETPKTGDASPIIPIMMVAGLSAASALVVISAKKKRKD